MHVFSENDATIAAYDQNIQQYLDHTPHSFCNRHEVYFEWLNTALDLVGKEGGIFEIGSGHGRAARYISEKGYSITRSDASTAFVNYLNQHGETALVFNLLKDKLPVGYNMIFANAVVPHFTPNNLRLALKKIHDALGPNGIFVFDAKEGNGERWIEEKDIPQRYSHYWNSEELVTLVKNHGYEIIFLRTNIAGGDNPNCLWTHIIAKRI